MADHNAGPSALYWARGTLMSRLAPEARARLLELSSPRRLPSGTVLVRQGEMTTYVYLLSAAERRNSACVKVTYILENGVESVLGIRVAGDVVGELAGLRRAPRSATIVAITPIIVRPILWADFRKFLAGCPNGWEVFSLMLSEQLTWANHRRVDFAAAEVTVRLARAFAELAVMPGIGGDGCVHLSQNELGMLIGAKPAAINRAVRKLRGMGAITTGYRWFTVIDLPLLHKFVQEHS
jgi:CRP/FNR family transcriptional regulator, cyclic AMP receptor protein